MKDFLSSTFLLVLVLDPFALALMIPSLLRAVPAERHMRVVVREMVFGLILLLVFLLAGEKILDFFGLEESTLSISGGIVLFLIALGMVFPGSRRLRRRRISATKASACRWSRSSCRLRFRFLRDRARSRS